jgi:hypothetical protein
MHERRSVRSPECREGWRHNGVECFGSRPKTVNSGYCIYVPPADIFTGDENVVDKGLELLINNIFSSQRGENFEPFHAEVLVNCDTGEPIAIGDNDVIDAAYMELGPNDNCAVIKTVVSPEVTSYPTTGNQVYVPKIYLAIPESGPEEEMLFSTDATNVLREIEGRFNT